MQIRKLEATDYNKGYLDLLKDLTVVGDISESDFLVRYEILSRPPYHIYVIESDDCIIVASGTLFIENKVIHNLGQVGHIEDIVVSKSCQGQNLGKKMIDKLLSVAKEEKCYKVILDCSPTVKGFYEKCGFTEKGLMMRLDF